jgi:hypothetical protein
MTATDNLWLPEGPHWDLNIEHHPSGDAGPFTPGHPKIVLHTTESPQQWIDGAIRQFATQGVGTPHLSIGYREGFRFPVVAQFIPFHRTAKTLEHPNGTPETNRARAVQIEICGRAAESNGWDLNWYRALANMLLLTQHRFEFPTKRPRSFPGIRYTGKGWIGASGIVGHCHAPNQTQGHTDPGRFDGRKLIRLMHEGRQNLKPREL